MRKGQIRRVNLSLHLTPDQSRADLRAMQQLQKWHQSMDKSASIDDTNMEIRAFHRDVYLAGLQLHLMDPSLCHHVAESLGRETLTLAQLLGELTPQESVPEKAVDTSAEQLAQLQMIRDEVAALKSLLEQQKLTLQQLRMAGKTAAEPERAASGKEELDLSQVDAPTEKMKKVRQKGIF